MKPLTIPFRRVAILLLLLGGLCAPTARAFAQSVADGPAILRLPLPTTMPAPAGLGAGMASGFLIGSLFRGGDDNLPVGQTFAVVLTQDLLPATPTP